MNGSKISPLAKRLADENGVDWQRLSGSGPGGRVVERDVLEHLAKVMSGEAATLASEPRSVGQESDLDLFRQGVAEANRAGAPTPKASGEAPAFSDTSGGSVFDTDVDDLLFFDDESGGDARNEAPSVAEPFRSDDVPAKDEANSKGFPFRDLFFEEAQAGFGSEAEQPTEPDADPDVVDLSLLFDTEPSTEPPTEPFKPATERLEVPPTSLTDLDASDFERLAEATERRLEEGRLGEPFSDRVPDEVVGEAGSAKGAPASAMWASFGEVRSVAGEGDQGDWFSETGLPTSETVPAAQPTPTPAESGDGTPAIIPSAWPLASYGRLLRRYVDIGPTLGAGRAVGLELGGGPLPPTPFLLRAAAKALANVPLEGVTSVSLAVLEPNGVRYVSLTGTGFADSLDMLDMDEADTSREVPEGALVVTDLSTLGLDEVVLEVGVPVLTLGRLADGTKSTLSLSGEVLPITGGRFLARVAEGLEAPVRLLI